VTEDEELIKILRAEISSHLSAWSKDSKELEKYKKWHDYYVFRHAGDSAYVSVLRGLLRSHKIEHPNREITSFGEWLEKHANHRRFK
jgi:hypothetical protein